MIKKFINEGKINISWNGFVKFLFLIEVILGIWSLTLGFVVAIMIILTAIVCAWGLSKKLYSFQSIVIVIALIATVPPLAVMGLLMLLSGDIYLCLTEYPIWTLVGIAVFILCLFSFCLLPWHPRYDEDGNPINPF